jgi:hypothetical protein
MIMISFIGMQIVGMEWGNMLSPAEIILGRGMNACVQGGWERGFTPGGSKGAYVTNTQTRVSVLSKTGVILCTCTTNN